MRSRTVQPLKQRGQERNVQREQRKETQQTQRLDFRMISLADDRGETEREEQKEHPAAQDLRETQRLDFDMASMVERRRKVQEEQERQDSGKRNKTVVSHKKSETRMQKAISPRARRTVPTVENVWKGRYAPEEDRGIQEQSPGSTKRKERKTDGILSHIFVMQEQYFDFDLLLAIIFLMCFGLVLLYSTSAYGAYGSFGDDTYYFAKQALVGGGSFVIMLAVSKLNYHIYGAFSFEIYLFAMLMMGLVQTPLGVTINGARRWIGISERLTLQPAEITKIAVILFVSYELCRLKKKADTREGTIRIFAIGMIAALGVRFLTDNLSTAIIVLAITCILYFIVHPKMKPFLILGAGAAALLVGTFSFMATAVKNSSGSGLDSFRLQRIVTWLDPEMHMDTGGFQVMQGLYAIGSGGFFGKGLGNSTQKLGVIPEAQNDMILAIICEELGVFGVIVILFLFGFLLYRLMFIARNAPDLYGALVAAGIFAHISLQVILNIMVVTNTIPTTGITLPFISYGGTSILFLMAEMGIALGVSRRIQFSE